FSYRSCHALLSSRLPYSTLFRSLAYKDKPYLFQNGANDGFHEAIGDTIVLSMTPGYLKTIGLIDNVENNQRAVINQQMKLALDRSEEHTSELQSRENLVCRLLLE